MVEAPKANPHVFNASTIPAAGLRFFAEGRALSAALRDTGFQLGLDGGEPDGRHPRAPEAPLQLVETQAEAVVPMSMDDELPRRTKPRRRRGSDVPNEPLKLVETQPGAEQRSDNQP